jgi:hypothetical protein
MVMPHVFAQSHKAVQTALPKPMTNRSRLPGALETTAICWIVVELRHRGRPELHTLPRKPPTPHTHDEHHARAALFER